MTPPTHRGSTVVGTSSVPLILLLSVTTIVCRSTTSTMTSGTIRLCTTSGHQNVCSSTHLHRLHKHKHQLQVEKRSQCFLPRANSRPYRLVPLNFILIHGHIEGPRGVTDFLDLCGVVGHRHINLLDIVELFTKLQLMAVVHTTKIFFKFSQNAFDIFAFQM